MPAPAASYAGGLHLNLCYGPPVVLQVTPRVSNEAVQEPPATPNFPILDDPPLGVPLAMPGANRDGFATLLQETATDPSGITRVLYADNR